MLWWASHPPSQGLTATALAAAGRLWTASVEQPTGKMEAVLQYVHGTPITHKREPMQLRWSAQLAAVSRGLFGACSCTGCVRYHGQEHLQGHIHEMLLCTQNSYASPNCLSYLHESQQP